MVEDQIERSVEESDGLVAKIKANPGSSALVLAAFAGGAYYGFCRTQGLPMDGSIDGVVTALSPTSMLALGVIVSAKMAKENRAPPPLGFFFGGALGGAAALLGYGTGSIAGYGLQYYHRIFQ